MYVIIITIKFWCVCLGGSAGGGADGGTDGGAEVAGLCSRGGWTLLQRWLELAPEVAGMISKAIKTVGFLVFFAPEVAGLCPRGGWTWLQRWLDLAQEVAGPGSRGGWTLFLVLFLISI